MERRIVDPNDDHLAAGLVLVEAVAGNPQPVLRDLAETDQPKDEPGHRGPQEQRPRLLFQSLFARFDTGAVFPSLGAAHMRAERLGKR